MTAFGVRDLVVRYGGIVAVDGVTFEARPGDIVALVGGDGAGKTSALRALAGAVAPAQGSVTSPGRRQLGYLPTDSGIYRDLTAEENLSFAARAYGLSGRRLAERVDELLAAGRLTEARGRLAGLLSGGMRQKLALAAAMVHRPALLVLDEPTTGVDPVSRAELWRGIARAAADGAAVIFSTTYLDEAERAGHVVALDAGRVLVEGPPEDIVASMPGHIVDRDARPGEGLWYRRGARFRVWRAGGQPAAGGAAVHADLQDALTVAALRARGAAGRSAA